MGAASYEGKQSLTEFMAAADKALYKAKNAGKNRVETTIRVKPQT
jgi:PleD family two-component response regulator